MTQTAKAAIPQKPVRMTQAEKIERLKAEWTETERVILRRRSVRLHKKAQVPEFMVKRILEAGRFAPSAGNCQPGKFVVVREPEIIDGITETAIGICRTFMWHAF